MANIPQIISGTTIVLGLLVLIASSLFLDWLEPTDELTNETCKQASYWGIGGLCDARTACIAATAIGVVIAIIQIFYGIFAVIKLKTEVNKIWQGIHALLAVLSIIGFAISIHYQKYIKVDKSKFFSAMTIIDAIFCVVAIVLSFTMFKK